MGKRRMTRQNKDLADEHKEEMIAHDSYNKKLTNESF